MNYKMIYCEKKDILVGNSLIKKTVTRRLQMIYQLSDDQYNFAKLLLCTSNDFVQLLCLLRSVFANKVMSGRPFGNCKNITEYMDSVLNMCISFSNLILSDNLQNCKDSIQIKSFSTRTKLQSMRTKVQSMRTKLQSMRTKVQSMRTK